MLAKKVKNKFCGGIKYFKGCPHISSIFVPRGPNIFGPWGTKIGGPKFLLQGKQVLG